ncbi:CBS domain-containing protein [Alicyclobacillus dauci]|uniref:CBS domain-containing protein n=1 Tax=Alicyclobacillus dauci TaxID=1475485 RepID=A0ABY6Z2H7_9BACL|nr:CBS domain-containing protein [Alicyclobacillus dauci]WAH36954.1 CBS domain-containing protein [Alicyclobacillus dauci]
MRVRDVMIQDVYVAHKDDLVHDVLRKFSNLRISGMPIVDHGYRVVGYISDGDIMRFLGKHTNNVILSYSTICTYYYAESLDAQIDQVDQFKQNAFSLFEKNVMQLATKKVITVKEDDDLVDVAELLSRRKIKKVPVVKDGVLVGIVSRGDVVRAVVQAYLSSGAVS